MELAAAFPPAEAERVTGDFHLVADFAYGTLTDDLCMLAARIH